MPTGNCNQTACRLPFLKSSHTLLCRCSGFPLLSLLKARAIWELLVTLSIVSLLLTATTIVCGNSVCTKCTKKASSHRTFTGKRTHTHLNVSQAAVGTVARILARWMLPLVVQTTAAHTLTRTPDHPILRRLRCAALPLCIKALFRATQDAAFNSCNVHTHTHTHGHWLLLLLPYMASQYGRLVWLEIGKTNCQAFVLMSAGNVLSFTLWRLFRSNFLFTYFCIITCTYTHT